MNKGNLNSGETNAYSSSSQTARAPGICPPAEILLLCHRAGLSPKQRREIFAHIRRCDECAVKSDYIRGILKDEHRIVREIKALIARKKRFSLLGKRFPFMRPALFIGRTGLAAAIPLVIFVVLVLMFSPVHQPPTAGRSFTKTENIELSYGPRQSTLVIFERNGVIDSRSYFDDFVNFGDDLHWKNANIVSFHLFGSSSVSKPFEADGDRLFVYALSDRKRAKSNLPEFILKNRFE